jgi:hypothetical protein
MAGAENKGGARLMRVFLGVAAGSALLAVVPQILNHYYGTRVDLGLWAFLAMLVSGLLGAAVHSLGIGTAFGALCGTVISLVGGIAYLVLDSGARGTGWRSILSGIATLTVLGMVLGLLGGLPVWTFRWLHRKDAPLR